VTIKTRHALVKNLLLLYTIQGKLNPFQTQTFFQINLYQAWT